MQNLIRHIKEKVLEIYKEIRIGVSVFMKEIKLEN